MLFLAAAVWLPGGSIGYRAVASTTAAGATADRAIDGDTNSNFTQGTCMSTDTAGQPWWVLDLGAPSSTRLTAVTLWNRADCCAGEQHVARSGFRVLGG